MMHTRTIRSATLAVSLLLVACGTPRAENPTDYPLDPATIETAADGALIKGRLTESIEVSGLPARSWLHLWPDGRVESLELAAPAEAAGHLWPRGSRLWFGQDGTLQTVLLGANTTLAGIPCRGGGKLAVSLHPSGALHTLFLERDTVIDGVPCKASVMHPVELDPAGRVVACRLAAEYELDGVVYAAGTDLRVRD